jgi:hypothetical protein
VGGSSLATMVVRQRRVGVVDGSGGGGNRVEGCL